MSDPLGITRPPPPAAALIQSIAAAALPNAELLGPVPALPQAASILATVIERSPEGALLLRSAYGGLALKTAQPLAPGTRVELRVLPGTPPTVSLQALAAPAPEAEDAAPPLQVDLGTTVTATVVAAPPGDEAMPVGTRLLLRVAAAIPTPGEATPAETLGPGEAGEAPQSGTIVTGAAGETVIDSQLGMLALDRRLILPAGTQIAFARLGAPAASPEPALAPPSQASGLPSLDQALAALDKSAPALAQQMRATLQPATAPALAGSLLFLLGALNRGSWPGDAVGRALTSAGLERLRQKLGGDLAELGRLSKDEATGEWQVLTVPLMSGAAVEPLRLYMRRRGGAAETAEDGSRFILEAELSRLGALQLDGMVRGRRLDVVLRSHTPLPAELREEATTVFRSSSAAHGFTGDIVFATAATFTIAPLAGLRRPLELRV
jgi:hypothetical protein